MIIYRPQRRSLEESMKEAHEFPTIEEMKQYIAKEHKGAFDEYDIVIDGDLARDERIGWNDCKYVCVKRYFDEDYMIKYGNAQCIGFCATDYTRR